VVVVAVAVVIAFAVISAGLDLIAMLVGVVLGVMFLPVVALVAADVACFASAAANLVLIEVDAANLFSNTLREPPPTMWMVRIFLPVRLSSPSSTSP